MEWRDEKPHPERIPRQREKKFWRKHNMAYKYSSRYAGGDILTPLFLLFLPLSLLLLLLSRPLLTRDEYIVRFGHLGRTSILRHHAALQPNSTLPHQLLRLLSPHPIQPLSSFLPARLDRIGSLARVPQQCRDHCAVTRRALMRELAHERVRSGNPCAFGVVEQGRCGGFVDDLCGAGDRVRRV